MLASQGNKTFISLFGAACDNILSDFSEYYYVVNLYMICFYPISFEKLSLYEDCLGQQFLFRNPNGRINPTENLRKHIISKSLSIIILFDA